MYRKFCSFPSIFRRLPLPLNTSAIAWWVPSFSQRRVAASLLQENNFTAY